MSGEKEREVPLDGDDSAADGWLDGEIKIPPPPPGAQLTTTGRRLYRWICEALLRNGRKIDAAGIQITMLVHTMQAWVEDMKLCVSEGRYGTSENGNRYEKPHSYNERNGRADIKRELPEACLTVMSEIEARLKESKTTGQGEQDDLFGDLLDHAASGPRNDARH